MRYLYSKSIARDAVMPCQRGSEDSQIERLVWIPETCLCDSNTMLLPSMRVANVVEPAQ